jgi:hypothetical protein
MLNRGVSQECTAYARLLEAILLQAIKDLSSPSSRVRRDSFIFLRNHASDIIATINSLRRQDGVTLSAQKVFEFLEKHEKNFDEFSSSIAQNWLEECLITGVLSEEDAQQIEIMISLSPHEAIQTMYRMAMRHAERLLADLLMLIEMKALDHAAIMEIVGKPLWELSLPWEVIGLVEELVNETDA